MRQGYRRFIIPGLTTFLMLVVLVSLGMWQVYRLQWKEDILAQITAAEAAPPVPLNAIPKPFTKVAVTGRFLFDHAAQFGAEVRDTSAGPIMGFYQIVPLEREHAPPIFVNRGWIPEKRLRPLVEPDTIVTVTGYLRAPEPLRWFSPVDNVAEHQFYTLNPTTIGMAVGILNPAPMVLVALGPAVSGTYPVPAQQLPRPPNNHLTYAITWFGLAGALMIVFIIWIRKALRS